ncbi:MAG: hypothetical protein ILP07_04200 [Treponema sp.]|nr:hypothetical protein [Treponema sp.]
MKKTVGVLAAALALALLSGCASSPEKEAARKRAAAMDALTPLKTIPEKRPAWVDSVPITKSELAFVGVSDEKVASDQIARNRAENDARKKLVHFYGTPMKDAGRSASASYGLSSDVFDPEMVSQQFETYLSEGVAKEITAREYYTEIYQSLNEDYQFTYKVYALLPIEKKVADAALKEFAQKEADAYKAKAAAERDAERRSQLEKAADYFGGPLQTEGWE